MSNDDNEQVIRRKRKIEEAELDITPMIDVTFLLLAFFVVVSKMDPQATMKLPEANISFSIPDKNCVVMLVAAEGNGETFVVYKGSSMDEGATIPTEDPDVLEEEVGSFVESEFSQYPTKSAVLIKAEGNVRTGVVEMVKRGIGRSELAEGRDIHIAVEEK